MARYRRRTIGIHEDRYLQRCREIYALQVGDEALRRAEIAALPKKLWRGREVFRVRCDGDFGRGPHEVWLPERVLWQLISLQHFLCPYHR